LSFDLANHVPFEEQLLDTSLQRQDHPYRLLDGFVPLLELQHQRVVEVVSLLRLALQFFQSVLEGSLTLAPMVKFKLEVKVLLVQRG
jgi:hypothetical protein